MNLNLQPLFQLGSFLRSKTFGFKHTKVAPREQRIQMPTESSSCAESSQSRAGSDRVYSNAKYLGMPSGQVTTHFCVNPSRSLSIVSESVKRCIERGEFGEIVNPAGSALLSSLSSADIQGSMMAGATVGSVCLLCIGFEESGRISPPTDLTLTFSSLSDERTSKQKRLSQSASAQKCETTKVQSSREKCADSRRKRKPPTAAATTKPAAAFPGTPS